MAATKKGAATAKPDKSKTKKPADKRDSAGVPAPDWERIEIDYRAGIKTLREIAAENGISHTLVARRAKRSEWIRDLSHRINARADELVSKAGVSTGVTTETRIREKQVIDANANAVAEIRLAHRRDIHRKRSIVALLMEELEAQVGPGNAALLSSLGELMRSPDDNGRDKLNDLYRYVISLPERAKTAKTLAETLRVAVDMERQAFGMDKDAGASNSDALTDLLNRIAKGNSSAFAPVASDPERDADA